MYRYEKNGRLFQFFVLEENGSEISVGNVEVFTEGGKIVDFEPDDLATRIYDIICQAIGRQWTLDELEKVLKQKNILPR